jgi:DNA-nicking Smr family endonuclease
MGPNRSIPEPASKDQEPDPEAEEFLRAMEGPIEVPDKDAADLPPPRKRPPRRGRRPPDGRLDLHGKRADEARHALDFFVERSHRRGHRRVLVITGRGRRSEQGVPVLKRELEHWVRGRGAKLVEEWSPAPRHLGGEGAYLLYLRR